MPMLEEVRGPWRRQLAGSERVHCGVQRDRRPMREGLRDMNIRPLQDRVIVKRIEGQDKTEGGIFIPDFAKELPAEGEVVAVGKGRVLDDGRVRPLDVKPGDRVLFAKFAGTAGERAGYFLDPYNPMCVTPPSGSRDAGH